jgi:hypothetical protein
MGGAGWRGSLDPLVVPIGDRVSRAVLNSGGVIGNLYKNFIIVGKKLRNL